MKSVRILTYAAGVREQEPPPSHLLLGLSGVILTPDIGSRSYESVQRRRTPQLKISLTILPATSRPLVQILDSEPLHLTPIRNRS